MPPSGGLIITIDGGGSGSRALAVTDGDVISRAEGGPLQLTTMGDEAIMAGLDTLLAQLVPEVDRSRVTSICLGIAGAGNASRRAIVAQWADERLPAAQTRIVRDVDLILATGGSSGIGIAAVAGTGAMVVARQADGTECQADGRGPLVGDDGSGFQIGLDAIRLTLRSLDGAHQYPETVARAICAALGIDRVDLAGASVVGGGELAVAKVAAIGGMVVGLAGAGDEVALQLVRAAARRLARSYRLVAAELENPHTLPHYVAGSIAIAPPYLEAFVGAAGAPQEWRAVTDPLLGGLLLAASSHGMDSPPGA